MQRICVFCGSSQGVRPVYAEAAKTLGKTLVENNLGLVYGGSNIGLMSIIADEVLRLGGEVIGVIPQVLVAKEVAHTNLSQMHIVNSMHERKALMAELSDGFIAMPGGMGTFDELCEILTWAQLGIHQKPCGLLNIEDYFEPLLKMFDHAMDEGFLRDSHRAIVLASHEPAALLRMFTQYQPRYATKWLDLDEV